MMSPNVTLGYGKCKELIREKTRKFLSHKTRFNSLSFYVRIVLEIPRNDSSKVLY